MKILSLFIAVLCTSACSTTPSQARLSVPPVASTASADIPYGVAVPDRPGFLYSPFNSDRTKVVDAVGSAPGTAIACPFSGRAFRVPEDANTTTEPQTVFVSTKRGQGQAAPTPMQPAQRPQPVAPVASSTYPEMGRFTDVTVDLDNQRLTAKDAGGRTFTCSISSGRIGSETPTGNFKLRTREPGHLLQKVRREQGVSVTMPFWSFFNDQCAIHGTTPNAPKNYPGSGGCVRIPEHEDAKFFFARSWIGLPITITGSARTYLQNNAVMPWQREGIRDLLVQDSAGWKFKPMESLTGAQKALVLDLIRKNEIRFVRPTGNMSDPRWKSDRVANFPNIPELGIAYSSRSWAYWAERLPNWSELVAAGIIDPSRQRIATPR